MIKSIQEFFRALEEGKIVFFVGAGNSLNSGLMSVDDVRETTYQYIIKPCIKEIIDLTDDLNEDHFIELIKDLQPELFYSMLLEATNDNNDVLDVWKLLHPTIWIQYKDTSRYRPVIDLEQLFIVAYSSLVRVPVFTVNYDLMLEKACEALGIPYRTIPTISKELQQLDEFLDQGIVPICKLHGTLKEDVDDSLTADDIYTTMKKIYADQGSGQIITDYLTKHKRTLCFNGYSGRDFDFCEVFENYFKDRSKKELSPYWFMSEADMNNVNVKPAVSANIMHAHMLPNFLGNVLDDCYDDVIELFKALKASRTLVEGYERECQHYYDGCETAHLKDAKESIKRYYGKDALKPIDQIQSWVFWIKASREGQNMLECEKLVYAYYKKYHHAPIELMRTEMMMYRERALFEEYRETARKIINESQNYPKVSYRYRYEAEMQIASYFYMTIPMHLHYDIPFHMKYLLKLIRCHYYINQLNKHGEELTVIYESDSAMRNHYEENQLRTYAIDVNICEKLNGHLICAPLYCWWYERTYRNVSNLMKKAKRHSNTGTASGAQNYLERLNQLDGKNTDDQKNVSDANKMLSKKSEETRRKIDHHEFDVAIAIASKNGNRLNLIKALFGKAKVENGLDHNLKELLRENIQSVTPMSFRQVLIDLFNKNIVEKMENHGGE